MKEQKLIVVAALAFNCGEMDIKMSSNIKTDLGADSLDFAVFIMKVEEEFDVRISDSQAIEFITIGDVLNHITK